ncbi:hypothetical protein, partial [Sansalvadorimonas verongulae]|uniref:hypothetical protein n=1 Tax=Sansalvadorimonas verongulae TaxID=2172824 RepID=UPI0018AD1CC9
FEEPQEQAVSNALKQDLKTGFEFLDNALRGQLEHLKETAPDLYKLYRENAGDPPEVSTLNPTTMEKLTHRKGCSADTGFAGQYRDKETGKLYYIKEPKDPESARNEVLMARLAGILGLSVPPVQLVRKDGRAFVVSEWQDGLRIDETALKQADQRQLARLYLVASVLGNVDILGYSFDNTLVDPQGQLIPLDWGESGEFCGPFASKRKQGTFAGTVLELDAFKDPKSKPAKQIVPDPMVLVGLQNAAQLFTTLDKHVLACVTAELIAADTAEIGRLVEVLGPDKPIDRQRLSRTIHERLAYLARRYPGCCGGERITQVEQGAISASGVDGYSLPVFSQDIERADLRLYHFMDSDNQPVTECWAKLTPKAARRLSDQLGLPYAYRRELAELNAYVDELKKGVVIDAKWRGTLERIVQLCDTITEGIEQHKGGYRPQDGHGEIVSQLRMLKDKVQKEMSGQSSSLTP